MHCRRADVAPPGSDRDLPHRGPARLGVQIIEAVKKIGDRAGRHWLAFDSSHPCLNLLGNNYVHARHVMDTGQHGFWTLDAKPEMARIRMRLGKSRLVFHPLLLLRLGHAEDMASFRSRPARSDKMHCFRSGPEGREES